MAQIGYVLSHKQFRAPQLLEIGVAAEQPEAEDVPKLWRFLPKAWTDFVNVADPREIDRRAQQEVPLDDVLSMWTIGNDPQIHIAKLQELIDGGVTYIYSAYGNHHQMRASTSIQRCLPSGAARCAFTDGSDS